MSASALEAHSCNVPNVVELSTTCNPNLCPGSCMERASKSDGLVHGASGSEELFAERGAPGAGTIGETFQ